MPKQKPSQPELIREERAEYIVTPEEQARKETYRQRLREFLQDPASRQIEGFPIGDDEAILALSDPPYYTACPNPFLAEIIQQWTEERDANQKSEVVNRKYQREPFATDVSEGKNDPIYNAHSYHTKVPHKAIMRYILHYTETGDIVFDGFCGTGMTGVAAQLCGDRKSVESLGYRVTDDGKIYEGDKLISQLGARKAVLNDLSPAATFIAYNYNTPVDVVAFEREAKRILDEVEEECGWMYETIHTDGKTIGSINYTIWSDLYACPQCGKEMVFWDVAVDHELNQVRKEWECSSCGVQLAKTPKGSKALKIERASENIYDETLQQSIRRAKQTPVLINYSIDNKNFDKRPDETDLKLINQIKKVTTEWFPTTRIDRDIDLWYERDYRQLGVYSVDAFFTPRTINLLSKLYASICKIEDPRIRNYLLWAFTAIIEGSSKLNRERLGRMPSKLSGTLYIGALIREINALSFFSRKVSKFSKLFKRTNNVIVSTQSSTDFVGKIENTFDYIFTDPPFGSNIIYSDLSILWEAWLTLFTNTTEEAVIHRRKKTNAMNINDYTEVMALTFKEMHRALKPGRWLTVEFHNSQNSVWGAIQEAILRAGFIIADVRTLDKQQGTIKQVATSSAVKQDLIISAYKPNDNLEERFRL